MLASFLQIGLILGVLVIIAPLLGNYMAGVFLGKKTLPIEKGIYRVIGLVSVNSMTGWEYIRAVLFSNLVMGILVFLILML